MTLSLKLKNEKYKKYKMSDAQYIQYENAHVFASEWRKLKITSKKMNKEEFRKNLQMDQHIEICAISETGRPVLIYIILRDGYYISTTDLKRMISKIKKPSEVIIVSNIVMNIHINKIIENSRHLDIYFYNYELLCMIIPNAPLTGKHRILSKEESYKLLNDVLICDINNLSKIPEDDPQCIWLGARPGNIIEIISPSYVTHEFMTYKIVIPRSSKKFLKIKKEEKKDDTESVSEMNNNEDRDENEAEEQENEDQEAEEQENEENADGGGYSSEKNMEDPDMFGGDEEEPFDIE